MKRKSVALFGGAPDIFFVLDDFRLNSYTLDGKIESLSP
jgi:hypothetical protein